MKKAEGVFSWVNTQKRVGNMKEKEQEVDRKRLRKVAIDFYSIFEFSISDGKNFWFLRPRIISEPVATMSKF